MSRRNARNPGIGIYELPVRSRQHEWIASKKNPICYPERSHSKIECEILNNILPHAVGTHPLSYIAENKSQVEIYCINQYQCNGYLRLA